MFSKTIYRYLKDEKILFVDDDKQITDMLYNLFFKGLSLETYKAYDGAEALNVFKAHHPTLVISDIKMPILDGQNMAHIMLKEDKAIKVIFISYHKDNFYDNNLSEHYNRIIYINKPITTFKLESALSRLYDLTDRENCAKI